MKAQKPTLVIITALLGLWGIVWLTSSPIEQESTDEIITKATPPQSEQPPQLPAHPPQMTLQTASPEEMAQMKMVAMWDCNHVVDWDPPHRMVPGAKKQMLETSQHLQSFIDDPNWDCKPMFQVGVQP